MKYCSECKVFVNENLKNCPLCGSWTEECESNRFEDYAEQEKYVKRSIDETLDSYEIVDTQYNGDSSCVISTRETYYVQVQGKALQLMTQECKYSLEKAGNDWKMTSFVDLKVTSRIKQ